MFRQLAVSKQLLTDVPATHDPARYTDAEAAAQMDQATQHNAAMMEQMAELTSSLWGQAKDLVQAVAVFKLKQGQAALSAEAPRHQATPAPAKALGQLTKAASSPALAAGSAMKTGEDDEERLMQAGDHPISSGTESWQRMGPASFRSVCLTTLCLFALPAAWAGRPLGTDDTGTVGLRTCQVESWVNSGPGPAGSLVFAPACGLAENLEIGFDYTHPRQRDTLRAAAGAALKWVPSAWAQDTPAGRLSFGLKLNLAAEHPADHGWRTCQTDLLALMTFEPGGAWAFHANLGLARERLGGETANLLNLSVVWTPQPRWLLFAETQTNSRQHLFGATINSAGVRWWLVKDRLGLDLTASRSIDAGTDTQWSMGFGWYGLGW